MLCQGKQRVYASPNYKPLSIQEYLDSRQSQNYRVIRGKIAREPEVQGLVQKCLSWPEDAPSA